MGPADGREIPLTPNYPEHGFERHEGLSLSDLQQEQERTKASG
jgi:hypothetical protein